MQVQISLSLWPPRTLILRNEALLRDTLEPVQALYCFIFVDRDYLDFDYLFTAISTTLCRLQADRVCNPALADENYAKLTMAHSLGTGGLLYHTFVGRSYTKTSPDHHLTASRSPPHHLKSLHATRILTLTKPPPPAIGCFASIRNARCIVQGQGSLRLQVC